MLICISSARGQQGKTSFSQWKIYKNQRYGFKVKYLGEPIKCFNESALSIRLPGEERAVIHIFVDKKPFVSLSGTFGGRYYFRENSSDPMLSNRVFTEKVILNGIPFKKDYWIVYGGAGGWDTVINCYTEYKGKYYIVSLDYNFMSGIPGMIPESRIRGEEKRKITHKEMVDKALREMLNDKNNHVKMFNGILSTFTLGK